MQCPRAQPNFPCKLEWNALYFMDIYKATPNFFHYNFDVCIKFLNFEWISTRRIVSICASGQEIIKCIISGPPRLWSTKHSTPILTGSKKLFCLKSWKGEEWVTDWVTHSFTDTYCEGLSHFNPHPPPLTLYLNKNFLTINLWNNCVKIWV